MWLSKIKYNGLRTKINELEGIVRRMSDVLLAKRHEKEMKKKTPWPKVCPNGCEDYTCEDTHIPAFLSPVKLQKVGEFLVCPECGEHFNPVETLSLEELTLLAYGYTEIKEVEDE